MRLSEKMSTIVLSLLLVAVGAGAALISRTFPAGGDSATLGPGYVPELLGALLAVLGLAVAITAWRHKGESKPIKVEEPIALLLTLVASVLFVVIVPVLGFFVTTLLMVIALLFIYNPNQKLINMAVAVGLTAVVYLGFVVGLAVDFPKGWLL